MFALVFGLFGLVIGSFLNVVILRRGTKGLGGRSGCMSCGHELAAADLIPVFSYLSLGGRCRYCSAKVSPQYPIVEAATAILFAIVGAAPIPLTEQLVALAIVALLICIAAYDIRHTIVPNEWVYPFAALAFVFALLARGDVVTILLTGAIAAAPFALLHFASRGRWMGLGDAKLALGIGFLLGPWDSYLALTAAFVVGALFFIPLVLFAEFTPRRSSPGHARGLTMKSEVPFGPFLIFTTIIVWFLALYALDPAALVFAGSL